jgi:hypothetical protein
MMSWAAGVCQKMVSGKWAVSGGSHGAMDSCHVRGGGHQKTIPFRTPPPTVKSRLVRGGGSKKYHQSSIGAPSVGP